MTRRLHQFVPTLDPGAVGTHLLTIQRVLREHGWESEVFSEHTKPPYERCAMPYTSYGDAFAAHDDDICLYHAAIGSTVADFLLARRPRRLTIDYHNVTPPLWFDGWEPGLSHGLAWGRAQLSALARRCRVGWADSAYNAAELETYGFRATAVLPILVDPGSVSAPDPGTVARLAERRAAGGSDWLFVGRIAPNKCQHDLVKALRVYRDAYDPLARLTLVGGNSSDDYAGAVRRFAADLGVADAVTLTGPVSDSELAAHYAAADVFVCVSEHEGFLVPLLEAWHHGVPVIAFAATAVPETLGGGGLRLDDKSPETVAAAVSRVLRDPTLAHRLTVAGRHRLGDFSLARTSERLLELAAALSQDRGAPTSLPGQ